MSREEIDNFTQKADNEKAFFNMEPGRCVHQSLYAIGYSHLKSKIQGKTVCVKREYCLPCFYFHLSFSCIEGYFSNILFSSILISVNI